MKRAAQFARAFIGDAARLNDALALLTGVSPNIARQLQGYYVEGGRLFPLRAMASRGGGLWTVRRTSTRSSGCRTVSRRSPQFDRRRFHRPASRTTSTRRGGEIRLHAPRQRVDDSRRLAIHQCREWAGGFDPSIHWRDTCEGSAGRRLAIVASALMLSAVITLHAARAQAPPQVVRVTAERFSFTPSEISVAPGTEIEFHLTSDDTAHGFHILGQGVDLTIPKRGRGETTCDSRRRRQAAMCSSVRACAAPDTASCAARSSSRRTRSRRDEDS